jgi:hypothetical protein
VNTAGAQLDLEPPIPLRLQDYDWREALYYAPFRLQDVAEVIAAVDGANDEDNWTAVVRLHNGLYGYVTAGCDYTGWDCQAGGHGDTRPTLDAVLRELCTDDDRQRLSRELGRCIVHEDCWANEPLGRHCWTQGLETR